ncbi:MAG TPA: hypothetical protein P5205_16855 [Candidatus Paceibacterota bacterium]|nr:hypothetical protein [Candidatus Paceibacterota bacterium]
MALKLFPTDLVGAVGNIVYQRGRQGTVQRARVQPLNPQTNNQMGASRPLGSLAAGWRSLPGRATACRYRGGPWADMSSS